MEMQKNTEISVNEVKQLIFSKVKSLFDTQNRIKENAWKSDLLKCIIDELKTKNLNEIYTDRIGISMQIEAIYDDSSIYIDEFYSCILECLNEGNKHSLTSFVKKLENTFEEYQMYLKLDSKNDFSMIPQYLKINKRLKYRQYITSDQLDKIINLLKEYRYDKIDIVILCEKIHLYNNNLYKIKDKSISKYDVLNMIRTVYEWFPDITISVQKDNQLNQLVDNLYDLIVKFKDENELILSNLPVYDQNIYSEKEYKKLYYDLMKKIQNEIYSNVKLIEDEDFYFDIDCKESIIKEYQQYLELYLVCRNYFENELEKQNELLDDNIIAVDNKVPKVNVLFSKSGDSTYFENDLKNVPEEYYDKVIYLLNVKKYGETTQVEDKQLLNHKKFKQFRELRDDQIRIIYKSIGQNSIIILGIGVKKADSDRVMYNRLTSRPIEVNIDNLSEELDIANETFDRIIDYCDKNHRKGNR